MAFDRLQELKGGKKDVEMKETRSSEIDQHTKLYEPVKKAMATIQANIAQLKEYETLYATRATEKEQKKTMAKVEELLKETTKLGVEVNRRLTEIHRQDVDFETNSPEHSNTAKIQLRGNMYSFHLQRFEALWAEYNDASRKFKSNLEDRTRRRIRLVAPTLEDEKVNELIANGQAHDFVARVLVSENVQDVIREIEQRHLDILQLEQQIVEIHELFRDLATLVEQQQEMTEIIAQRVEKAKMHAGKGEEELDEAAKYAAKARKRQCCLVMTVLAVLLVILIPSIASSVRSS